jgi:N-terminal 7TM region of histidine kinase
MDWNDPAGVAYAVAAAICAAIAFVTWRRREQNPNLAVSLTCVMLGGCWWSVGLAVAVASDNETVAAIALLAYAVGPSSMVVAFLCLGYSVARPHWVPRRRIVLVLFIEPLLNTVALATNPWHQLEYGGAGKFHRLSGACQRGLPHSSVQPDGFAPQDPGGVQSLG